MIGTESVTHVTQNSATLNAQVNPSGSDTAVQFQYVADATSSAWHFRQWNADRAVDPDRRR